MIASSFVVANKKFSENQEGNNQNDPNSSNKPTELAPEEKKRGKRMMGVLMGTLSKFKSEEVDKTEANLKRILLEQRLAQKLKEVEGNFRDVKEEISRDLEANSVTQETCSQFQTTQTLPVIFFKRAN